MTKAQADEVRVKWKQRVHPLPCEHLNQELESGDAGYLTGTYHCLDCGESVAVNTNPSLHVQETRSSERLVLQCSIIVANGVQTGDGQVLNVSKSGCLVEAAIRIKPGDHLQLRLFLPDSDQSMCVSLAVVHWVVGFRFGVEFLKMDEKYRSCLDQFIGMGNDPWKLAL